MTKRILIVDDEPHMRLVTQLSLKKGGFDTLLAGDAREALALAASEHPDLIVLDVVMPGMDGLAALRELKSNPATATIPVIMLTSRGQTVLREEAQTSGAVLYLTKPFAPSQLLAQAKQVMGLA